MREKIRYFVNLILLLRSESIRAAHIVEEKHKCFDREVITMKITIEIPEFEFGQDETKMPHLFQMLEEGMETFGKASEAMKFLGGRFPDLINFVKGMANKEHKR